MPNKKINALDVRTAVATDLMLVGDPTSGTAYKSTLATLPLVPYTGATGAVNLGAYGITAASIIKSSGTSSQFLKADGSVDSSVYITGITSGNVTTALGFTPVPTSRTLTINGTTLDLSADRSWTIPSANIYNSDGTLTGARTLTQGGFNLTFVGSTHTNRITSAGRLLLGTTTESTFLLDVNGTARILGLLTCSGGLSISGAFSAGSTTLANFQFITSGNASSTGLGFSSEDSSFQLQAYTSASLSSFPAYFRFRHFNNSVAGMNFANQGIIRLYNIGWSDGNVANISGNSLWLQPQYNFTIGSFAGIVVRGMYYDPVATSLTNVKHIAIETRSGDVLLGTTSGSVGVGVNTTINASAIVDITSTTKGFLPPRMTTTQINAIATPVNGLMAYNTTIDHLCVYQAGAWVKINHSPM